MSWLRRFVLDVKYVFGYGVEKEAKRLWMDTFFETYRGGLLVEDATTEAGKVVDAYIRYVAAKLS